jgi:hypothetical protein
MFKMSSILSCVVIHPESRSKCVVFKTLPLLVVVTDIALVSDRRHRPHVDSGYAVDNLQEWKGQQHEK